MPNHGCIVWVPHMSWHKLQPRLTTTSVSISTGILHNNCTYSDISEAAWDSLKITTPFCQYRNSHYKVKTISWLPYLSNWVAIPWKYFLLRPALETLFLLNRTPYVKIVWNIESTRLIVPIKGLKYDRWQGPVNFKWDPTILNKDLTVSRVCDRTFYRTRKRSLEDHYGNKYLKTTMQPVYGNLAIATWYSLVQDYHNSNAQLKLRT